MTELGASELDLMGAWVGLDGEHTLRVESASGCVLTVHSEADLLPGAQITVQLWSSKRSERLEVAAQVLSREYMQPASRYRLRMEPEALPLHVSRHFNVRNAYRVAADPDNPISATVRLETVTWKGVLVDASQEGLLIRCRVPLEKASQYSGNASVVLDFPEGETVIAVQLRRLGGSETECQIGMAVRDDGSLEFRQSMRRLREYVMRRQRELLARRSRK